MNVNKKAASLYQSMDLWIALYRRIHECDHNTAHDAFDEWADALTGEAADQSTTQFHEAVHASYEKMLAEAPKEEPPLVQHDLSKQPKVFAPGSFDRHEHKEVRGGPLLELPHESRSADHSLVKRDILKDWKNTTFSEPGQRQGGPVGGPILDTGKDPLSFKDGYNEENVHWGQKTVYQKDGFQPIYPPVMKPAELRANLEKVVSDANKYLDELGDVAHPSDLARTQEVKELAEGRLKMLDELEAREKERTGRRLSLARK